MATAVPPGSVATLFETSSPFRKNAWLRREAICQLHDDSDRRGLNPLRLNATYKHIIEVLVDVLRVREQRNSEIAESERALTNWSLPVATHFIVLLRCPNVLQLELFAHTTVTCEVDLHHSGIERVGSGFEQCVQWSIPLSVEIPRRAVSRVGTLYVAHSTRRDDYTRCYPY
jgi:hypothetical protein